MLLPIPWECDQVDQIRDAVPLGYDEFQQGIEPDACVARMHRAGEQVGDRDAGLQSGGSSQGGHARHRGPRCFTILRIGMR